MPPSRTAASSMGVVRSFVEERGFIGFALHTTHLCCFNDEFVTRSTPTLIRCKMDTKNLHPHVQTTCPTTDPSMCTLFMGYIPPQFVSAWVMKRAIDLFALHQTSG